MTNIDDDFKKKLKKARHPLEIPMTILSVLITLSIYGLVSYLAIEAATNKEAVNGLMELLQIDSKFAELLVKYGGYATMIVVVYMIIHIIYVDRVFIGKSSNNEVRLVDSKATEVYDTFLDYAKKLGLKKIPVAYISSSDYESKILNVHIRGDNAISINKKLIKEAYAEDDFNLVYFTLARRLSHIYLGHHNVFLNVFAFAAQAIPVYNNILERIRCYSTDKVVACLIGEDNTLRGIYDQNYDKNLYDDKKSFMEIINMKIRKENRGEKVGQFLENLFADKPSPIYRFEALLNKKRKGGKVFI